MARTTYSITSDQPQVVVSASRASVTGSDTSVMRFPAEHQRYYTAIKFVEYKRTNPKVGAIRVDQADIILPLPSNLMEYYAINYADTDLDEFGGFIDGIQQVYDYYISKGGWGTNDELAGEMETLGAGATDLAQAISRSTASFFSDKAGAIIDRVNGNVVNPHTTAIFKGVALREHSLEWKVSPRSAAESQTIQQIRDYVRERMHPAKKSEFLLDFPDEVYVGFYADGSQFLFPIFKSVVTSISADLSSEGTNAFYKETDSPVVISLKITFKEVESNTRETFSETATDVSTIDTSTESDE